MSSYLPSLKWTTTPSRPPIATDAPLSALPTHERAALAALDAELSGALQQLVEKLPCDDPWRHMHTNDASRRHHLLRFLRFNSLDVAKASAHIQAMLRWRVESRPTLIPADCVHGLRAGMPVARLRAVGAGGELLFFAAAARYVRKAAVGVEQLRATTRMFEDVVHADGCGRAAAVVDFSAFGARHVDVVGLKRGVSLYVDYYPEAFYKVLLVNYPKLLYAVWRIIAPMLDARTVSRVIWIAPGESVVEQLEAFDRAELPRWLGGEALDEDVELLNGDVVETSELGGRF